MVTITHYYHADVAALLLRGLLEKRQEGFREDERSKVAKSDHG